MIWFRHDSAAHRDAKMKKLKRRYGITGYGLYWYCLELVAGNVNKNNITFEIEDDCEDIAHEWSLDRVTVSEIMAYMVELKLFESNDNRVTCLKMAHRLDDTNSRNPEVRKLIGKLGIVRETERLRSSPTNPEESSDRLDKTRIEEIRTEGTDPSHDRNANRQAPIRPDLAADTLEGWGNE